MNFLRTLSQKGAAPQALIARGDAARDQGAWARAASAYKAALDAKPDLTGIWVQYGHVLKESGEISAAVEAYGEALTRAPDHAETYVHMAHALKRVARFEEAMEAFEKAIELDPLDEESAQELFSLQQRLNPSRPAPAAREQTAAAAAGQELSDLRAALQKERETSAANALRLSALQTLYEDVQTENQALREQIAGQQDEIEKQRVLAEAHETLQNQIARHEAERAHLEERLTAAALARDELVGETEALKQTIEEQQAGIDSLKELTAERDEALAKVEALRSQMRDHDLRTDLAREEFLRSEGQIALMKDMFLREGEL